VVSRADRFRLVFLDASVGAKPACVKGRNLNKRPFLPVELASTIATLDNSYPEIAFSTPLILGQLAIYFHLAFHLRIQECRPLSVESALARSRTGQQF
jgi:hypothetical protein